jgi:murein DD-endopeptidase MepM/ murein hydrolase activator NlpD
LVAQAKISLEEEKEGLEQTKDELEVAQVELEEKRKEADRLLTELIAIGAEYEALVEEAEVEAGKLQEELDDLEYQLDEAEQREYEEWLAAQPKPKPPENANTGGGGTVGDPNYVNGLTWLVPISYTHFSSPYGWRIHPVYGDMRFHYGVDLSAPSGTPIVASRSGVVSRASYDSSSGYHVYINHQDGFSTRYLHMTHYIVSPGQWVSAGQVIGYCGSTGASTGPHLHFSLYYNGIAQNPADYINI